MKNSVTIVESLFTERIKNEVNYISFEITKREFQMSKTAASYLNGSSLLVRGGFVHVPINAESVNLLDENKKSIGTKIFGATVGISALGDICLKVIDRKGIEYYCGGMLGGINIKDEKKFGELFD